MIKLLLKSKTHKQFNSHLFPRLRQHRIDLSVIIDCMQVNLHVWIARTENVLFRERFAFDHANTYLTRANVGGLQVEKINRKSLDCMNCRHRTQHDNNIENYPVLMCAIKINFSPCGEIKTTTVKIESFMGWTERG